MTFSSLPFAPLRFLAPWHQAFVLTLVPVSVLEQPVAIFDGSFLFQFFA
jgi:hypothetical protein